MENRTCTTCKHEPKWKEAFYQHPLVYDVGICNKVKKFWMCSGEIYKDSDGMFYHKTLSSQVSIGLCMLWEAKDD